MKFAKNRRLHVLYKTFTQIESEFGDERSSFAQTPNCDQPNMAIRHKSTSDRPTLTKPFPVSPCGSSRIINNTLGILAGAWYSEHRCESLAFFSLLIAWGCWQATLNDGSAGLSMHTRFKSSTNVPPLLMLMTFC